MPEDKEKKAYSYISIMAGSLALVASLSTLIIALLENVKLLNIYEIFQNKDFTNTLIAFATAVLGTWLGFYFGRQSNRD